MLTIDQTNNLKGLLLFLIIIGHIKQFFLGTNISYQWLLYSFHVSSFFFLPFIFNNDKLSYSNILKNFRRLYIPYILFFLAALLTFHFLMKKAFDPISVLTALLMGSAPLLKNEIGISAYWFLPAFMSLLILLMFFNTLSGNLKKTLIALLIVTHLLIPSLPTTVLRFFPFGLYLPLYLFIIGLIIKYILENGKWENYSTYFYFVILIILLIFSYGTKFNLATTLLPNPFVNLNSFIVHDFIMIIGFLTMIKISKNLHLFNHIGKYSLAFYTIHPFVIQALNKIYPWTSIVGGIFILALVLFITFILVKIIYTLKLNSYIYPR